MEIKQISTMIPEISEINQVSSTTALRAIPGCGLGRENTREPSTLPAQRRQELIVCVDEERWMSQSRIPEKRHLREESPRDLQKMLEQQSEPPDEETTQGQTKNNFVALKGTVLGLIQDPE